MGFFSRLTAAAVLGLSAFAFASAQATDSSVPLPIVDLGYARQQASSYNVSSVSPP